jgi:hypothetical protein
LVVECERFSVYQLVVQAFAHRLHDVTFFEVGVLLTELGRADKLLFELEFMLERVVDVPDETFCRRTYKLINALVV